MTFEEFWKAYHREDPNEALEKPWRLRIHLTSGKHHDVQFPGSVLPTETKLLVGLGPRAKFGDSRTTKFCKWSEIAKVEKLAERRVARSHG